MLEYITHAIYIGLDRAKDIGHSGERFGGGSRLRPYPPDGSRSRAEPAPGYSPRRMAGPDYVD